MPPVNGRQWISPSGIATAIARGIGTDDRIPAAMATRIAANKEAFVEVVADAIRDTGLKYELTLLRLVEKIKDSIGLNAFGALAIPNSVDVNGMAIKTPVGEIYSLLQDAYTPEFLDMFDEEGEPLLEEGA